MQVDSAENIQYQDTENIKNSIRVYPDGKWIEQHHNPAIFPATQEWYERLSHAYPNLEKPPIKKSSKEIIKALLDDGNVSVLCWVSDTSTEPTSSSCIELVTGIGEYYEGFDGCFWLYATPITPIKTFNQTIIDYTDGKVVLEGDK